MSYIGANMITRWQAEFIRKWYGDQADAMIEWMDRYMPYTGRRSRPLPPGWQAIRAAVIARDPQCRWGSLEEDMADPGRCPNRSTDADHIGDPNDHSFENLRGLCTNHHATRTGRQGAAGKAATMRTRKRPKDPHPGYKK